MLMEKHVADDGKNQHGFPRGFRFVPKEIELIRFLKDKLDGRPLPYPLPSIFHDVRIRDFHPASLHDVYERHQEDGFIYFFDRREFPTRRGGRSKPVRATRDGVWKASGGGKALTTMKRGGVVVGYKLTLVFYQKKYVGDKDPDKTEWGMNEYTRINGPDNKKLCLTESTSWRSAEPGVASVGGLRAAGYRVRTSLPGLESVGGLHAALERVEAALYTLADAAVVAGAAGTGGGDVEQAVQKSGRWFRFISDAMEVVLKVADLALYRLYKLKKGKGKKDTGEGVATSSIMGTPKVEELPSPGPTSMASVASTSQAPAEASDGDNMLSQVRLPHCYHDSTFDAPSSAPGPSSWVTPAAATNPTTQPHKGVHAGFMGLLTGSPAPATYPSTSPQQKVVNYSELADWDSMPPMAVVADDLPSQQQAAEHSGYPETAEPNDEQPLKMLGPPPLPAPAAESYLDDEFMAWYQAEQQQQQDPEAASPWFPMTGDDFMLPDEDDDLYKLSFEELFPGIQDGASPDDVDAERGKSDTDEQV